MPSEVANSQQTSYEVRSIKPLDWVGQIEPRCATPAGVGYFIARELSGRWKAAAYDGQRGSKSLGMFDSIEAAKDACRGDYEQRIYSVIEWV